MKSINTRTYTNVALTAIVILLAVLALRPFMGAPAAHAQQEERGNRPTTEYGQLQIADSNREIAKSNLAIANAIKESAKSSEKIATSLGRLSEIGGGN